MNVWNEITFYPVGLKKTVPGAFKFENKETGHVYVGYGTNPYRMIHRNICNLAANKHLNIRFQETDAICKDWRIGVIRTETVEEAKEVAYNEYRMYLGTRPDLWLADKSGKLHVNGCYRITDTKSGRFYIGHSNDVHQRFSSHRHRLEHNMHLNKGLQEAFNDGAEFIYTWEEFDTKEEAMERETQLLREENSNVLMTNVIRFDEHGEILFRDGEMAGKFSKVVNADGVVFCSVKEAARQLGITPKAVRHRIKSKKPRWAGFYHNEGNS